MEKVTANAVFRAFQKQKTAIVDFIQKNGLNDEIGLQVVMSETHKPVIAAFIERTGTTMKRGYSEAEKIWPEKLAWMDFSVPTSPARVYLNALENLHLSQRQGSISATTENEVRSIVAQWVQKMKSKEEIVEEIQKLSKVFWKNRADLIAINQIGKAFQYGNFVGMKEYHDAGYLTLKEWSTVGDNRVTKTHTQNQSDWYRELNEVFSGTGDLIPPASDNPRCRCALLYRIGNIRGTQQPKEIQKLLEAWKRKSQINDFFQQLTNHYSYENDIVMQNAMTNWQWSGAEYFWKLANKEISEEEAISLFWWKTEQYAHINEIILNGGYGTEHDGIILNLRNAINSLPRYSKTVWQGISQQDTDLLQKLEKLEKWDIFVPKSFFPTSKKKEKAQEFWEILLKINDPKTGWDFGKIDAMTLQEYEVLFNPGISLEFVRKSWNIYIFNEI